MQLIGWQGMMQYKAKQIQLIEELKSGREIEST